MRDYSASEISKLERRAGITQFVKTHPGFSGTLKKRFCDFIVKEISPSGEIANYNPNDEQQSFDNTGSNAIPIGQRKTSAESAPAKSEEEIAAEKDLRARNILASHFPEDTLIQFISWITSPASVVQEDGSTVTQEPFKFPAQEEKDSRTAVHKLLRTEFAHRNVDSETTDDKSVKVFKKNRNGKAEGRKSNFKAWPQELPLYLEFVMMKENKETTEALTVLAGMIGAKPKIFSTAGTKDKRGITRQFVTAYKVRAEQLARINPKLYGIKVGHFKPVAKPLKLGDLQGNHFTLVIRDVVGDDAEIHHLMSNLQSKGFINYFGLQRFGKGSVGTHEIGKLLLKSDWEQALKGIMSPCDLDRDETRAAKAMFLESGDAKAVISKFKRFGTIELTLLKTLATKGSRDYLCALRSLPRNMRTMYVHAYQSFIWNQAVSERIRLFGLTPVVGDLVVAQDPTDIVQQSEKKESDENENENESEDVEVLIQVCTIGSRSRSSWLQDDVQKARVLTSEDDLSKYTIFDVVLPQPGYKIIYPENEIGAFMKNLIKEDGLDDGTFASTNWETNLPGGYRRVMGRPSDLEWKIKRYTDYTIPLEFEGDEVVVEGQQVQKAVIVSFSLKSSSYATMLMREFLKPESD
eukprot:TRINITY_DN6273_c0_g1_i1.p1 TRINITY_DN6273_c0_g1~~TRINITY_DN6273_c0_g1_i1.p1  ORF type:complete len:677 (-),score=235.74 TRINITY_DN6273_c0_g1_i1:30-1934(-)